MQVQITSSYGRGKYGKQYFFIRPAQKCGNRSRRVEADRANAVIEKWFTPLFYYEVNGFIIGSNNPANALREYWRVCEREHIGKAFEVKALAEPVCEKGGVQ